MLERHLFIVLKEQFRRENHNLIHDLLSGLLVHRGLHSEINLAGAVLP